MKSRYFLKTKAQFVANFEASGTPATLKKMFWSRRELPIPRINASLTQHKEEGYGIVPKHYLHAACKKEFLRNFTSMQLAGRNFSEMLLPCSLQEGISPKFYPHAACRKEFLRNFTSMQLAGTINN